MKKPFSAYTHKRHIHMFLRKELLYIVPGRGIKWKPPGAIRARVYPISRWCKILNLNEKEITRRIEKEGRSAEEAFTTPCPPYEGRKAGRPPGSKNKKTLAENRAATLNKVYYNKYKKKNNL